MEVALEMEDDLFFADLTKQICLLIMDDDDDPFLHSPPLSLQAYSGTINPPARPPLIQDQRAWLAESKGTGVFIPRSLQPRKKEQKWKIQSTEQQTQQTTRQFKSLVEFPSFSNLFSSTQKLSAYSD